MQFLSPLSWVGGKTEADKFISSFFPNKIKRYVELFAGSAAIGLRLMFNDKVDEVILNDINSDLMAFWNDVKTNNIINKYPKLNSVEEAKNIYNSLPKFGKKGWETLFQNCLGWSGRENTTFSITRYELKYYDCLERVKLCEYLLNKYNAILENKNYFEIIKIYDDENTFFI
ncbi:DNA adenine methylase [Spiroplasma endosymbiont of Glossina fuscipes fuscipes]|uniref:DNA adenine methylase n=1 Tax=Spiroplasma endosymbiont of Glossina fuscipes fuscipes TaxID=2004463 RepID=UPI003C78A1D2